MQGMFHKPVHCATMALGLILPLPALDQPSPFSSASVAISGSESG
jgi:hypothetical protein